MTTAEMVGGPMDGTWLALPSDEDHVPTDVLMFAVPLDFSTLMAMPGDAYIEPKTVRYEREAVDDHRGTGAKWRYFYRGVF